jgi:hypothetical protein
MGMRHAAAPAHEHGRTRSDLDGPAVPIRVEPVRLPQVEPAPEREPVPAPPPKPEPDRVPA